jgi:FKBP-type peptidyl-prolyl cis-trans isomerase
MKNTMLKAFATLACAAVLVACGGGSDNKSTTTPLPPQPAFTKTDTVAGSGDKAVASGDLVTFHYTGYVYDETKSDKKGAQFESSGTIPLAMTVGVGARIVGWDQGLIGMKAGGKRTLLVPANMAFGPSEFKDSTGKVLVPANTAVVYDLHVISFTTLTSPIPPQPAFTKTDATVGSGTEAVAKHMVSINYKGYLYDDTKSDKKGVQFDSSPTGSPFTFLLGVGSRIQGWDQGIVGMKVGGKRTLLVPTGMAYSNRGLKDAQGNFLVPANTAVVYEIEMTGLVTNPPASTVQPTFTKIDTQAGTGTLEAAVNDKLTVHYTGYLYHDGVTDKKGTKFESSLDSGNAFPFTVGGNVIAGWNQGVVGMKAGSKRTLIIPASLAYGSSAQGSIPANSALVFDIEVLSITR